jgi:hypothetical protein
MSKLSNTEILFIRACKSGNRRRRLLSVYRRFYGKYDIRVTNNALRYILADIVDKVNPISSAKLLEMYDQQISYYMYDVTPETNELLFRIFMSRLSFTNTEDLLQYGYKPKFEEL